MALAPGGLEGKHAFLPRFSQGYLVLERTKWTHLQLSRLTLGSLAYTFSSRLSLKLRAVGDNEFQTQQEEAGVMSSSKSFIDLPSEGDLKPAAELKEPSLVRVRLSVVYRVHSRQILCIGGSEMPFGWSFLSIAKVPMIWSPGDIWTTEIDLAAGSKVEYKYVILEEQDWTKQGSLEAEGLATFRTERDEPPDYHMIQKKMAIVAWQPGPNRSIVVPTEDEIAKLTPGSVLQRELPRQLPRRWRRGSRESVPLLAWPWGQQAKQPEVNADNTMGEEWETLKLDEDGVPLLSRRDKWSSDLSPPRDNRNSVFG